MAYQMTATAMTLNDLEGHLLVAGLFKRNSSKICAAFTRCQLTVCSPGSTVLAELRVLLCYTEENATICCRIYCATRKRF